MNFSLGISLMLLTKSLIVLPFWAIGFFWSVESAFYVSSIIGGYLLYICFLSKITIKERIIQSLIEDQKILFC